jgi:AraC family transcriptional regulator, transcriptional activator of pobA
MTINSNILGILIGRQEGKLLSNTTDLMSYITQTPEVLNTVVVQHPINGGNLSALSYSKERLTCYEMIWVRSGSAFLDLNLASYQVDAGHICCLAPGQIRKFVFGQTIQAEYLRISPAFFFRVCTEARFPLIPLGLHHLSRPLIIGLHSDMEPELHYILQKIGNELSVKYDAQADLLGIWLRLFMTYLKKQINPDNVKAALPRDMELADRFLKLLAENFTHKKMVADYANELQVTPNYLNQIVKRVSGFSVRHHIQQFLILEAKRLALASSRNMKQIAYDLGFDDLAHFSRFFKNKSGVNFTDFKRGVSISQ